VIRAVLDRSAMESYAHGYVHVGELIGEIADEMKFVGIPAATLVDAHAQFLGDDYARALLRVLVTLPGTVVLKLDARSADTIAPKVPMVGGDLSRAHSISAALEHQALYFTTESGRVAGLLDDQVFRIPTEDA
jgi:hypothetical protein